jgi:hypothetical protein
MLAPLTVGLQNILRCNRIVTFPPALLSRLRAVSIRLYVGMIIRPGHSVPTQAAVKKAEGVDRCGRFAVGTETKGAGRAFGRFSHRDGDEEGQ